MAGVNSISPTISRFTLLLCIILSAALAVPANLRRASRRRNRNCKRFVAKLYPSPKRVNQNCYNGAGHAYRGNLNVSENGRPCRSWRENGNYLKGKIYGENQHGIGDHNFCRNPDPNDSGGPWCFVDVGVFARCDIVACNDYGSDPLFEEPVKTCDRHVIERIFPDTIYEFRGKVHYITRNNRKSYNIHNFLGGDLTSVDTEPFETTAQAWNFCTRNNDTLTFVTSYDDKSLYAYFEIPNVMIRVTFRPRANWTEVAKPVYQDCISNAYPTFDPSTFTSIRQVFSVNEPKVVFLLKNDDMVRCEWENGVLNYINSTKSPFGSCPRGRLHFIDGRGQHFQLLGPSQENSDFIIRSNITAVEKNPGLAKPLLGYFVLDSKSLVKLRYKEQNVRSSCSVDGNRSRLYEVYNGKQLERILPCIKRSKLRSGWLRIHEINVRKSSFCEDLREESCCNKVAKQVLQTANKGKHIDDGEDCENDMFLLYCKVDHNVDNSTCPNVSCFSSYEEVLSHGGNAICEIPLADDPSCSVQLVDILGSKEGDISFQDATEAFSVMDSIAASMDYQKNRDSKFLSALVDSVKALKKVDYNSLSPIRARNLILDVVSVVDNIVDERSADVWVSIQENGSKHHNDSNNGTLGNSSSGAAKGSGTRSPSEILFAVESVLEGIVLGQVSDNSTSDFSFSVNFKTKNVISNIRVFDGKEESVDLNGSFVTFQTSARKTKGVAIVSQYPKLMQLIAKVDNSRSGVTETASSGNQGADFSFNKKQNLEYVPHSPVISASMIEKGLKISSGVTLMIPFIGEDIPDPYSRDSKFYFSCRYLEPKFKDDRWESRGCEVSKVDHAQKLVYCSCNHTTNFAILLQVVPPKIKKEDMVNLQILSYVGESISVLCLLLTLGAFILLRHSLKSPRMVAHFHLVVALIIFHVTQLLATLAEREKNHKTVPCITVAALTHFSLLASFCWMLVEGILLYISVVNVFHSLKIMNVTRYIIGWGIPTIISAVTMACGLTKEPYPTCYLQGVGDSSCPLSNQQSGDVDFISANADASPMVQLIEWCWLSASSHLIWAMVVPAAIAMLANTIVLIRVSIVIAKSAKSTNMYRPTTERKKEQHIRKCLKGAFILMPILGLPWLLGLIPQAVSHVGMLYAFTALNSVQGFFILLFYCVLSSEVRSAFNRRLQKWSIFYSQNSSGDHHTDSRRSRKKSGTTWVSDTWKDDGSRCQNESSMRKSPPPSTKDAPSYKAEALLQDKSVKSDEKMESLRDTTMT